jgi:hypothetical protein
MTNEDLLLAYYAGDDPAFAVSFQRWMTRLRGVAFRMLGAVVDREGVAEQMAIDALQDVAQTRGRPHLRSPQREVPETDRPAAELRVAMNNEAFLTKWLERLAERDAARLAGRPAPACPPVPPRSGWPTVVLSAPLPALMGAWDTGPRPPFQVRVADPDGARAVTVFETDEGDLAVYVQAADPGLAGRRVRVRVATANGPLAIDVSLEARGPPALPGRPPWAALPTSPPDSGTPEL